MLKTRGSMACSQPQHVDPEELLPTCSLETVKNLKKWIFFFSFFP